MGSDVIYTERRGQSQKPEEIYQLIEELVPEGESRLQRCRHERHQNALLSICLVLPTLQAWLCGFCLA